MSSHGGSVIAVCGARGGVGTTTVAVNLALQLTNATHGHVALLDLHLQQGTTALMLGVKPAGGLRIALEQPERADALFLDRVCVEINTRLRLIAAEEPLNGTLSPTPDGIRRVLDLLRRRFNYIVIDMPMPTSLAAMQALRAARHLLVVMAPDLVSIRDTDRMRQLATDVGNAQVSTVLNRIGMQGGLKFLDDRTGPRCQADRPDTRPWQAVGAGSKSGKACSGGMPGLRKGNGLASPRSVWSNHKSAAARRHSVALRPEIRPMKSFGRRPAEAPLVEFAPRPHPVAATAAPDIGLRLRLRAKIMDRLDSGVIATMSPDALRVELEPVIHQIADEEKVQFSALDQAQLAQDLTDDMIGFGPLEPLLRDDSISDIMVNGPDTVFIEVAGKLQRSAVHFRNSEHAAMVAQKMVATIGRRIDESSPLCDARLPDGSRVNVIFPPLALDGPCISIRKFTKKKLDFIAMVKNGSMVPAVAHLLEIAARCRCNIIISGGTGSGKTTLLNALSRMISPDERIVTIEDAAELQLQQPHVVRLETRTANLEGRGEINQRELLRNALRMRPDRIIVGEVRGTEAYDMLQAMNTGHDGSISTVHANTTRDAIGRIENMVQMATVNLPARAIRAQIAGAMDLIIQIERMRDGVRRVTQISDVCGMEGDVITMNEVVTFEFDHEDPAGKIVGHYRSAVSHPSFETRLTYFGLEKAWMEAMQSL